MPHSLFLEKISEGLFIEGFNSTRANVADHLHLDTYSLEDLERAVRCLRSGRVPPLRAPSHRWPQDAEEPMLMPRSANRSLHVVANVPDWVGRNAYCGLGARCAEALRNRPSNSHRHRQEPRARAAKGLWCTECKKVFHPSCFSLYHRDVSHSRELVVQPPSGRSLALSRPPPPQKTRKRRRPSPPTSATSPSAPSESTGTSRTGISSPPSWFGRHPGVSSDSLARRGSSSRPSEECSSPTSHTDADLLLRLRR
eukprot:scaffold241670_cov33-Tisochrysis_lutea.AAC.1